MPKLNCDGERVTVPEAAKMLDISQKKLKKFMRDGKLPIGIYDETENEGGCSGYYIYRGRIQAYLNGFDISTLSVLLKSLNMEAKE